MLTGLRIALVHEWLAARAGSEKTFEEIARCFPTADVFALSADPSVDWQFGERRVRTTFLDRHSLRERRALTLALMPLAWALKHGDYDVVISSSHAFARWFRPARRARHLSYVYSPMRYAWYPDLDDRGAVPGGRALRSVARHIDKRSVAWTNSWAAISTSVADRLHVAYGVDASTIFPPVDVERFRVAHMTRGHLLVISRWIPYKRIDLAIDTAIRIGVPVVVAGRGPQEAEIVQRAHRVPQLVTVMPDPDDETLAELYASARAVIFPACEDFGIVPVEAQAAGTPVVALGAGGSVDTVIPGVTGTFATEQSLDEFARATKECLDLVERGVITPAACVANAERFSAARFRSEMTAWVEQSVE